MSEQGRDQRMRKRERSRALQEARAKREAELTQGLLALDAETLRDAAALIEYGEGKALSATDVDILKEALQGLEAEADPALGRAAVKAKLRELAGSQQPLLELLLLALGVEEELTRTLLGQALLATDDEGVAALWNLIEAEGCGPPKVMGTPGVPPATPRPAEVEAPVPAAPGGAPPCIASGLWRRRIIPRDDVQGPIFPQGACASTRVVCFCYTRQLRTDSNSQKKAGNI